MWWSRIRYRRAVGRAEGGNRLVVRYESHKGRPVFRLKMGEWDRGRLARSESGRGRLARSSIK